MHHRLARPHRDPPERHRDALGLQRLLDQVVVADRGAAGRDEDIGAAVAGAADALRGGLDGVGGDAEIDGLGAFGARQRPQRVAVGIDDLAGAGLEPGITSSSPVASTATFGRRRTASSG